MLYRPDYRNAYHQQYCSRAACRAASKTASQRRWQAKPENKDIYRGQVHVQRVQAWRKAHPGYWRVKPGALQDVCSSQIVVHEHDKHCLDAEMTAKARPLQDLCLAQDPLFVGFMAHLTGALQDDIELQITRFQTHGQTILGKGPGLGS